MGTNNNNINMFGYYPQRGPGVYGGDFVQINSLNTASGNVDLYTVPSGKSALVFGMTMMNVTAGTVTTYPQIKLSGVYYKIGTGINPATNAQSTQVLTSGYTALPLQAGDTFAVNNSAGGVNLFGWAWEFDSDSQVVIPRIMNLVSGANTLYTVPSGKTACVVAAQGVLGRSGGGQNGSLLVWNGSGSTRSIQVNVVNSGGSPSTANQIATNTSLFNGQPLLVQMQGITLGQGDFINVTSNSSTAGQIATAIVWEV